MTDHPRVGGERRVFCDYVHWDDGSSRVGGERAAVGSAPVTVDGSSPRGRGTHWGNVRRRQRRRIIPAWAGNARPLGLPRSPWTDHPRVGGERSLEQARHGLSGGSSPRGRGTHWGNVRRRQRRRIIPAWAGNAVWSRRGTGCRADHPRVGGERISTSWKWDKNSGSSPRGRGTQSGAGAARAVGRIIPAWAGNASARHGSGTRTADHPRVGGERSLEQARHGLSGGSSPRGRGTLADVQADSVGTRIIPAWAGNARARWSAS